MGLSTSYSSSTRIYIYIYIYIYIVFDDIVGRRVWRNILNLIKYLGNRVRRFLDSGMETVLRMSYSSST